MTPEELRARLQALTRHPIELKITEGSTYASARRARSGALRLTVHRLFLHAPTPVLQALVRFAIRPDRECRAIIRQMAHLFFTTIEPPLANRALSDPKGACIDLQELYDRVNAEYFEGKIAVPIAWFSAPRYKKFRHITFGVYDRTEPIIRINRLLDHDTVPLPFVEFIVYHEMLHAVCKSLLDPRGRLLVHTAEFKRLEKRHKYYPFAKEWEKGCLTFFRRLHGRP